MFSFVPREKEPREQIPVPQVMIKVFSSGMLQFSTGLSATFWLVPLHRKFVRVECVLSLSRISLSGEFTVGFTAEMSDVESVVEESKPKDPSANPKPQSSELVDEVFSLFKGYLNTKLEAQGKLIEGQSKIQKSASEFKFKGNGKQFEFINAKLQSLLSRIKANADDPSQVNTLVQDAEQFIRKGQKLIKIADRSKDGWLVVQEYESDDLTSNSEDEKRLKKAKNAAEKQRKNPESRSWFLRNVLSLTTIISFFAVIFFFYLLYFVISHLVGMPEHPTIK